MNGYQTPHQPKQETLWVPRNTGVHTITDAKAPALPPWTERHAGLLKALLGLLVLCLAGWTVWLMRRTKGAG